MPVEISQAVTTFLTKLAHLLLVPSPPEDWSATIAEIRQDAAAIALEDGKSGGVQAAASLRLIAAAIETYPDFFRKRGD
jgi:hypothetical protein